MPLAFKLGSSCAPEIFDEFYLPSLKRELPHMTHKIFHVDGKGMLRHLDRLLERPEIHAFQWVQGVRDDLPIMQCFPPNIGIASTPPPALISPR